MVDIISGKVSQCMCLVCDVTCGNCGNVILLSEENCSNCGHPTDDDLDYESNTD